jgi:hypothetical protein
MGRLSLYARERIVSLLSTNTSVVAITKRFSEEGIKMSRSTVNLFVAFAKLKFFTMPHVADVVK